MIKSFRNRRLVNRLLGFIVRMSIIVFGSLTTVLLGLRGYHPFSIDGDIFSCLALISSALVTVLSGWEAFFDHRWLWILYSRTLLELRRVSDDLEWGSKIGGCTEESLDRLYEQFHLILDETNMAWTEKRRRERMPGDPGVLHEPPRLSPHAT